MTDTASAGALGRPTTLLPETVAVAPGGTDPGVQSAESAELLPVSGMPSESEHLEAAGLGSRAEVLGKRALWALAFALPAAQLYGEDPTAATLWLKGGGGATSALVTGAFLVGNSLLLTRLAQKMPLFREIADDGTEARADTELPHQRIFNLGKKVVEKAGYAVSHPVAVTKAIARSASGAVHDKVLQAGEYAKEHPAKAVRNTFLAPLKGTLNAVKVPFVAAGNVLEAAGEEVEWLGQRVDKAMADSPRPLVQKLGALGVGRMISWGARKTGELLKDVGLVNAVCTMPLHIARIKSGRYDKAPDFEAAARKDAYKLTALFTASWFTLPWAVTEMYQSASPQVQDALQSAWNTYDRLTDPTTATGAVALGGIAAASLAYGWYEMRRHERSTDAIQDAARPSGTLARHATA